MRSHRNSSIGLIDLSGNLIIIVAFNSVKQMSKLVGKTVIDKISMEYLCLLIDR